MYFTFVEKGLIANPQCLESAEHWKTPSLFEELKENRIDIKHIDKIFRTYNAECSTISEWIAARDRMKHLRKGGKLTINPNLLEIVKKRDKKEIEKLNEAIHQLEKRERNLHDSVVKSFGPKGIRKLTRKDVKKWPVFTRIMIDLYNYLIPFYETKPHYYSGLRDESKRSVYPEKLFKVIAGLLQEYYPSYFENFSPNAVKTRIKPLLAR